MKKKNHQVECEDCGLYGICLVAGLDDPKSSLLDQIVTRRDPVARHATLFNADDPFTAVYAVKSGAFKTYVCDDDGTERVVGFYMPGELLGLDAIKPGLYGYTAKSLEASSVCKLGFDELDKLGKLVPEFQMQLIEAMSNEIHEAQHLAMLTGRQIAEERLVAFLLNLSQRHQAHGLPGETFRLCMSRQDIASYLGLALETISRVFTRLQEDGLLRASGKNIKFLDVPGLQRLAKGGKKESK
jgi:CRP/FNR family transcriptional regulator